MRSSIVGTLSVGLLAVVLLVTAPGGAAIASPLSMPASSALGAHASLAAASGAPIAATAPGPASAAPAAGAHELGGNDSPECAARLNDYLRYFSEPLPTAVVPTEQGPCEIGHDEPGLNFVSNESYSGSRVQFVVDMPPAGSNTASAFSTMWVGLWLAGVPCSYRGQSYLEVQLNPPYNDLGLTENANWTVQAPVWDLVPAGSCDPQCQNDTAFTTIGGVGYCEDDAAISGVGTYTSTGWGNFAPGDSLVIQLVGQVNGTSGLSVFINDTTNPGNDLSWTYSRSVTASGEPLTPFYNSSAPANGGWGYGLNVEATWENCPAPTGVDAPTPCNSYDGPAVSAVGVPEFVSASYWNASTLSYANPFPWTATTSSAGACSGLAAPCQDFTTYGGTGSYPYWSLHAWDGSAWWMYGGKYPNEVTNWSGPAGEFNPLGYVPTYLDPTTVASASSVTIGNSVDVTSQVVDPNGVAQVDVSAYFCFGSSTPSVETAVGTLTVSPWDTSNDGNWTAAFSTGTYSGTVHYWVRAESVSGVWSLPVAGTATATGVTSCGFPAPSPPVFGPANVTSLGGGYALDWADASPGVVDYTVTFTPVGNGSATTLDAGNHTELTADLGAGDANYTITVTAVDAAGLNASTGPVSPAMTLPVLSAALSAPTSTAFWVGHAQVPFTATASGGLAPYAFTFTFGDGTTEVVLSNASIVNVTHDFGTYFGDARATVAVTDAVGDTAVSARALVQVWATPLGVEPAIAAGDGLVNLTWTPPASPAGPVLSYTVFYTTNPVFAWALTSIWPLNSTGHGLNLWNTSRTYFDLATPDNLTIFLQVVAWDAYGEGLLSADTPILNATPAPLLASPIQLSQAGGPAPFTVDLTSFVTNATNDPIADPMYVSGVSLHANATVWYTGHGAWVNGTLTFPTPGLQLVVFHVSDLFSDIALETVQVLVTPGTGPFVTLTGPTANGWFGWAGTALSLSATAVGGTGPYQYTWSFGDGNEAGGANVTHTYTNAGNFTVSVSVEDLTTQGTTVRTQSLLIFAPPTVAIATAPGPNGSLSWLFSAVTGGGSGVPHVTWSFGDGSVAYGLSVRHDFVGPGTYVVNASSADPAGPTAQATYTLVLTGGNGGGSSSTGTFLGLDGGSWGPVAVLLALLTAVFFVTTLYFWSRGARPPAETGIVPVRRVEETKP